MKVHVRLFDVYEGQAGGQRPPGWLIPIAVVVFGVLMYAGEYLRLTLAGALFVVETALSVTLVRSAWFMLILCVEWFGVTLTHQTNGGEFEGAGVLDGMAKNLPRTYPDLSKEMQPRRGLYEMAVEGQRSKAPVGMYIEVGGQKQLVPGLTEEKLEWLVNHLSETRVKSGHYKVTYGLYASVGDVASPWKHVEVDQFRAWLLKKQWAEVGPRKSVYMRIEAVGGFQRAWNLIARG